MSGSALDPRVGLNHLQDRSDPKAVATNQKVAQVGQRRALNCLRQGGGHLGLRHPLINESAKAVRSQVYALKRVAVAVEESG